MKKILFIEDEKNLHEIVRGYFKRENMEVVSSFDGEKAVEVFKGENFDAVILDVMLPNKDGFQVLKQIRKESNIPVLMLTARTDEIDRLNGLKTGADDYIVKPFSPRELVARVKAVLRRIKETKQSYRPVEIAGIRVDTESYEARWKERKIPFTATELKIILKLIERSGKVYTRNQLLVELGDQYEVDERTVDAHLKNIRKKLNEFGAPDIIETVRGFGYRIKKD